MIFNHSFLIFSFRMDDSFNTNHLTERFIKGDSKKRVKHLH